MKRHRAIAVITATTAMLALIATAGAGSPAPPRFGISVDRDPIVQEEPFTLTISVSTESAGDPEIRLPQFRGLRVLRQSESHPRSFSFSFSIGGQTQRQSQRTSNYTFLLVADHPGEYPLDPIMVVVDGRQFKSDPHTLRVVESSAATGTSTALTPDPDRAVEALPPAPAERDLEGVELAGAMVDPTAFVQLEVNRSEVVVGEMLVLTVWLYTSTRITDVNVTREPGTDGFWAETLLPGQRRLNFEAVRVGGLPYERAVLRKLALFPIEPGTLTIAPVEVSLESRRGGLFSRPTVIKRASPPVEVAVAALPEQGRPPGFDSANVGRFRYRVEADPDRIEVGDPLTLSITISGEGNMRKINPPQVREVEGFKVYPPESEIDLRHSEAGVTGTRVSRVLMIPERPGIREIPAISWSFFDPEAGKYHTLRGKPITVTVEGDDPSAAPGATDDAAASRGASRGAFEQLAERLRSIESRASLAAGSDVPMVSRPWYLAAVSVIPLGYLALLLGLRARRRAAESKSRDRSRRAGAVARKELAALRRTVEQNSVGDFFGELRKVLERFLESRLGSSIIGDTMEQLRARLVDRGIPRQLAERVLQELESCDFARFARSAGTTEEHSKCLERMRELIDELAAVAWAETEGKRR